MKTQTATSPCSPKRFYLCPECEILHNNAGELISVLPDDCDGVLITRYCSGCKIPVAQWPGMKVVAITFSLLALHIALLVLISL